MRPRKEYLLTGAVAPRWSEAMVSEPDEATPCATQAINKLKFDYVHMLILRRLRCEIAAVPAPIGQREIGNRG
jgi:hypothetical protein